jgi:hypothetical protein
LTPSSRPWKVVSTVAAAALAVAALGSCRLPLLSSRRPLPIRSIEDLYQEARALRDEIDLTRSRGSSTTTGGVALGEVVVRYDAARAELDRALAAGASPPLSEEDGRALEVMQATLARELVAEEVTRAPAGAEEVAPASAGAEEVVPASVAEEGEVDCRYDPELVGEGKDGHEALSKRIYACFSVAAHTLSFDGEPMDRLTIFGLLPLTGDSSRREKLWRTLAPVWEAVSGDNGPRSPYRTLVRKHGALLQEEGERLGESVRSIGVEPAVMEEWLTWVLQKWHDISPDAPIEPWDFSYDAGRASRALSGKVPRESLRAINDRFYRDLGADPEALQVRYDLEPRASKDPVAFTTFGRRPRTVGDAVLPGEPWVFASYQIGGLDNLLELLHETGHAVHIAAIRTRPAFADWPDSDIFTEGIADLASLEVYEPTWQRRYLGASVPIETGIAAKYSGIVMDIAWALFEVRVHREPERDPNQVWTEITRSYFRIEPHPELAWWAVRGQLIDAPGYMMNYAAGAILAADLRARLRELHGSYAEGDPGWYERVARSLYRFGLEKASKDVIEEFLGRPVSPQALLEDMERAVAGDRERNPARGPGRGRRAPSLGRPPAARRRRSLAQRAVGERSRSG